MITILAIGKKHEDWVADGVERYQKRLRQPFDVNWVLLSHSSREGLQARQEESEQILRRLESSSYVVLLDEIGTMLDSPSVAARCREQFTHGRSISLIIGGAYGVTDGLRQRADFVWSLSKLVFPHQLVRLLLIEQLYRAQAISSGHGYHHQ